MDFDEDSSAVGYTVSRVSAGLLKITVTNPNLGSYALKFKLIDNIMTKAGRKYALDVSDAEFYDTDNHPCSVNYGTAGIYIKKNGMDFLAETHDGILDYLIDAQRRTAIVVG